MSAKTILFNSKYHPIAVSDAVYEQVLKFVEQHRVCGTCGTAYTADNLQVAENCCKTCFLKRSDVKRDQLAYIGVLRTDEEGRNTTGFLDPSGTVYAIASWIEAYRVSDSRSIADTLRYWKFPVPQTCEVKGQTISIYSDNLSIFGEVKRNAVVVLNFREKVWDVLFLAHRNGGYQQLNRHTAKTRTLFAEARARGEATRDVQGYHIAGYTHAKLTDYDLLRLVSEVASEQESEAE